MQIKKGMYGLLELKFYLTSCSKNDWQNMSII